MAIEISNEARDELKDHAKKHDNFGTFADEVLRFAEGIWHDVRSAQEHKGGANDPAKASNPDVVANEDDTPGVSPVDPETAPDESPVVPVAPVTEQSE